VITTLAPRNVYTLKEADFIKAAAKYPVRRGFFEMVRFDFVLDSKMNVYLMEVNMSPNLSSKHFAGNRLLYEQVIYSLLRLVGVARPGDYFLSFFHDMFCLQIKSEAIAT
jgi:tubulin monoglycylase TTLL15